MTKYKVAVEDGWNGYGLGDLVETSEVAENDLAVLIQVGVLVPTTQKVEEAPNGNIPE